MHSKAKQSISTQQHKEDAFIHYKFNSNFKQKQKADRPLAIHSLTSDTDVLLLQWHRPEAVIEVIKTFLRVHAQESRDILEIRQSRRQPYQPVVYNIVYSVINILLTYTTSLLTYYITSFNAY